MIFGSLIGDVIGSYYEWHNVKHENFELFNKGSTYTDDSVMTIATADALMCMDDFCNEGNIKITFAAKYKQYYSRYPEAGYGGNFINWAKSDSIKAYNSFGNGSAMRVSPVSYVSDDINKVRKLAKLSASVTHNHKEGIKGAEAVASAIFLTLRGYDKQYIKEYIENNFKYNLNRKLDDIRPSYKFDVSCQGSVPEAIIAFLESENFEDSIRKAISIGGDSDTIAAITASISKPYYKYVPENIIDKVSYLIDYGLKKTMREFVIKYNCIY